MTRSDTHLDLVEEKGLTIGGYESAFFADLSAAYILEKAEDIFADSLFNEIYHTVMTALTSRILFSQSTKYVTGKTSSKNK